MCRSSRLYQCQRCHKQVIICTYCDRGNRYCPLGCAKQARVDSLKRASQKYQQTRSGQRNNAERQRRFRERRREKVTHQGSAQPAPGAVLPAVRQMLESRLQLRPEPGELRCHVCGRLCSAHLRQDFLMTGVSLPWRTRHRTPTAR